MNTSQIKHKIKRYTGILLLAAVLCWGIYYFVTVSQASGQIAGQTGADQGDFDPGDGGSVGPEGGDPGDTEPGADMPGDSDSETEAPDDEDTPDEETDIQSMVSYAVGRAIQAGVVNADGGLFVRSGPGKNYKILGSLANGQTITILAEENGWYKISYGSGTGYISGEFVKLQEGNSGTVADPNVNEADVQKLITKGFPKSYAVLLAGLQAKHPAWVFEPVQTGLDWNTAIKEESVLSVNMVPTSSDDSWKSTDSGAYNWSTNKWTILDGSSWVGASPAIISYYMDPRNFLNETYIYQFETLQYESYQNAADVSRVLSGTFMSGALRDDANRTYAATFVEAGQTVKVNPSHLAARCKQEQGTNGTSPLISGKYAGFEGYYNYFNIEAYGTPASVLYQNGLSAAKKYGWNSVRSSIVGGSKFLAEKYINLEQNTLYFQKFNVTNSYSGLYRHQYMANIQGAANEGNTMGNAYNNKDQAFVFRIPVYKNMPENACPLPSGGNPNNWLKSLAISGYNLTPTFNGSKTSYDLIVGPDTASVKVTASPVVSTSSVSGTGNVNLNYGSNSVKVICKAQNGTTREYVINIVRQGKGQKIKGDIDGDGEVSLIDLVTVKRHILKYALLDGEKYLIGDVDGDGEISLMDYVKIKRHILGYEKLN